MKFRTLLFALLLLNVKTYADAAMAGVWTAGGQGAYALLFPEDSIAFNKIQMKKEVVSVQLYKGFAVVKGEYWMYNTTKDTFTIKTGYPLRAFSDNERINESGILVDSLSQLRVFADGQQATIIAKPELYYTNEPTGTGGEKFTNWYIWVTKFKPMGYTKIDVYFIVNTNYTHISEGYNHESYNGFIYILESGATWKQPIEQGTILVQLMDGLAINDVHGATPHAIFSANEQNGLLKYTFTNLTPTSENNIIITYNDNVRDFNFAEVNKNPQGYFQSVDKLSQLNTEQLKFIPITFKSPTDIPQGVNPFTLVILLVVGGAILVIALIILVIVVTVRRVRKRKK